MGTKEEFNDFLGYLPPAQTFPEAPKLNVSDVPTSKDWTGVATTAVKNQGRCGSCWAFSATEQLESMFMLNGGNKVELAPQELVDCKADKSERDGCGGGDPMSAYTVIEALGGLEGESSYPYRGSNQQCQFNKGKVLVTASNGQAIGKNDEAEMRKYVGSTGPLSTCGMAESWSSYTGGVMTSCGDGGGHCFQIVGYGTDNGKDYWKVRNSWGTSFGEAGHIRLQRDVNMCGIAGMANTVVATAVGPTPSPSPTPPSPTPAPLPPTSPRECHAIAAVVTDDWCIDNCAAGFCPSDLCQCDFSLSV